MPQPAGGMLRRWLDANEDCTSRRRPR
jgi:hypothetical protein